MSNVIEYKELIAFHPGYYIEEIMEDMEISKKEFANIIGLKEDTINALVNGEVDMTNDIAKKVSDLTGTSVELWLNLQKDYDKCIAIIEKKKAC